MATNWKWTDMSWLAQDETLDWAFFFESGAYEVAASLALDGLPATWPRTKGRRP